jgi:hypothetical protein
MTKQPVHFKYPPLPLLAEIDSDRVRRFVNDPRIKARPAFHYRLANCHIERADWSVGYILESLVTGRAVSLSTRRSERVERCILSGLSQKNRGTP